MPSSYDNLASPSEAAHRASRSGATDADAGASAAAAFLCFDCDAECAADPWVSVTHGVDLCIACAGRHRGLGTHLSFVRSLALDSLKPAEAAAMAAGGNARFRAFLDAQGVPRHVWLALDLELRYQTPAADLYRRALRAELDGAPEIPSDLRREVRPPPLPKPSALPRRASGDWTPDASVAAHASP